MKTENALKLRLIIHKTIHLQGSFPAGTPGNGVPKVIFTVGTAFPGIQWLVNHSLQGTLFCEHAATYAIVRNSPYIYNQSKLSSSVKSGQTKHYRTYRRPLSAAGLVLEACTHTR